MRIHPVLAATAALVVALLGGCGIPDDTDVVTVGPGQTGSSGLGDDDSGARVPPAQQAATEGSEFVKNFLSAAAASDVKTSVDQVKQYLDPSIRAGFKPLETQPIKVIHLTEDPTVTLVDAAVPVRFRTVGTLDMSSGVLTPTTDPDVDPSVLTLNIKRSDTNGWFVSQLQPENQLLLTDTALSTYYLKHQIYFWNTDRTGLVPDERYMARTVRSVQQPTLFLNWLTGGPAQWLTGAVLPLGPNSAPADNVPAIDNNGKLSVALGAGALGTSTGDDTQDRMNQLREQLQWSLHPLVYRTLALTIGRDNPVTFTNDGYFTANPAYRQRPPGGPDYERFAIYKNAIHRLSDNSSRVDGPPVLKPEADKDLQWAALRRSSTYTYAAVVTSGKTPVLKVGAAAFDTQSDLKPVGGLKGALGHPVWASLNGSDAKSAIGLIIAGGKLYSFAADGSAAKPVEWTAGTTITSVSVAPDGRRVALVAGGKLWRTVLITSGDQVTLGGTADRLQPVDMTQVDAVVWTAENGLAVAGVDARNHGRISSVGGDGSDEDSTRSSTFENDLGAARVTYLAAVPSDPVSGAQAIPVSYMSGASAYDLGSGPTPITVSLLVPQQTVQPGGQQPVYPFFLY